MTMREFRTKVREKLKELGHIDDEHIHEDMSTHEEVDHVVES